MGPEILWFTELFSNTIYIIKGQGNKEKWVIFT